LALAGGLAFAGTTLPAHASSSAVGTRPGAGGPTNASGSSAAGKLKLVASVSMPANGTKTVYVPAPAAECAYLHAKYPTKVPAHGCRNVVTFGSQTTTKLSTSATKWSYANRWVRLCSVYSCKAWNVKDSFRVKYHFVKPSAVWDQNRTCSHGAIGYTVKTLWCKFTGNGTKILTEGGNFEVTFVTHGVPVHTQWFVRADNYVDGSWHARSYHS
jgi:hypothetical protein